MDRWQGVTDRSEIKDFDHRVIVAGSRNYNDYKQFKEFMDYYMSTLGDKSVIFISGMARSGADKLIIDYCKEKRLPWSEFPADWDTYDKSAGYVRNAEMAKYGNHLIVFYNGSSKGTKHMIDIANKKKIKTHVVLIEVN